MPAHGLASIWHRDTWQPGRTPRSRTARAHRPVAAGALVGLIAILGPNAPAQAAKGANPNHSPYTATPPLGLVSESTSTNPNGPPWCLAEDAYDQRVFSGYLKGSYTTSEQLCGLSTDVYSGVFWDAGGIGLASDVSVVGQLSDLTITSPDGTLHHAVLVGQSTSRGITTSSYATCYVPPYTLTTNVGGTPLIGGTWRITLSGQISSANWTVTAYMADVSFQQANCPVSEQNLLP